MTHARDAHSLQIGQSQPYVHILGGISPLNKGRNPTQTAMPWSARLAPLTTCGQGLRVDRDGW